MGEPIKVVTPAEGAIKADPIIEVKPPAASTLADINNGNNYVPPPARDITPPLTGNGLERSASRFSLTLFIERAPITENPYSAHILDQKIEGRLTFRLSDNIALGAKASHDKFIAPEPQGVSSETHPSFTGGISGTF